MKFICPYCFSTLENSDGFSYIDGKRKCPRCGKLLPEDYGQYDVKFISVIGITGSGKTVYLSQLLKNLQTELSGIGMNMVGNLQLLDDFVNDNKIEAGKPLPYSTPIEIQQPMIVTIEKATDRSRCTLVLYDVAGELFTLPLAAELPCFAPFITHSDGIIVLIDPFQCVGIANAEMKKQRYENSTQAIKSIIGLLNNKDIPVAVCMSKCDEITPEIFSNIEEILDKRERHLGIPDSNTAESYLPVLDADLFNEYEKDVKRFFEVYAMNITTIMNAYFENFAYFLITALGCDVNVNLPLGPIVPKRIADPLVWLLYKLNIISASGKVFNPMIYIEPRCPYCGDENIIKLRNPHIEVTPQSGFMNKLWHKTEKCSFEYQCGNCKQYFNYNYDNEDEEE